MQFVNENKEAIFAYLDNNNKYYPLSFSQQMMCVQSELYKNASYQLTIPFYINQEIDKTLLTDSLKVIVNRHDILRTAFPKMEHTWIQVIKPDVNTNIRFLDFSDFEPTKKKQEIANIFHEENAYRFDITHYPLFKITCIKIELEKYLIILNMHHAIFDGLSFPIFVRELLLAYNAKIEFLPKLSAQYVHFVLDQKSLNQENRTRELDWWREQLKNCPVQSDIPSDYPAGNDPDNNYVANNYLGKNYPTGKIKNSKTTVRNQVITLEFPLEMQERFMDFCKNNNISLYILILSGVFVLLNRITQQADLVIGTILNQRNRVAFENLIGDFNNLVPLRFQVSSQLTRRTLVKSIQQVFFDAFAHQKVMFNELINELNIKRNKSNLALYNVFFDSINLDAFQRSFADDKIEILTDKDIEARIVPLMDLFFLLVQQKNSIGLHCAFNPSLMKHTTVEQWLEELKVILVEMLDKPDDFLAKKPINHKVTKRPAIFCLPGADGQTAVFTRLTKDFSDYRCYAIKYQKDLTTVEEKAKNFLEVIKSLEPDDNSILIGLSIGGVVAFEMIQQLNTQTNFQFAKLILLDAPLSTPGEFKPFISEKSLLLLLVMNYTSKFFGNKSSKLMAIEDFRKSVSMLSESQQKEFVYNWIKSNTVLPLPALDEFQQWMALMEENLIAFANYQPKPCDANITVDYISSSDDSKLFHLLVPNQVASEKANKKMTWKNLFPNAKFHFQIIPNSDHFTLFTNENLKLISELLLKK